MNIFLDLDGTILDISIKYYSLYRDFCITHGLNPLESNEYWPKKRRKEDVGIPADLIVEFQKFWINNIETERYLDLDFLKPFANETLFELNRTYNLYLVTLRRDRQCLIKQLTHLDIKDAFESILSRPQNLLQTQSSLDIKTGLIRNIYKKNDAVVGDTATDILLGKNLGITAIAVSSGLTDVKILRSYSPDHLISCIKYLTDVL